MSRTLISLALEAAILTVVGVLSSFVPQIHFNVVVGHLRPTGLRVLNVVPYLFMAIIYMIFILRQRAQMPVVKESRIWLAFLLASCATLPFCISSIHV